MEEKLSIQINIADRFYPLKIDFDDEEHIRKAAKTINEKLQQYKQKFSAKDTQDFLAMTALQFATTVIENEKKQDVSPIMERIKELTDNIDEFLETS